jgi:predicted dehydrogenase
MDKARGQAEKYGIAKACTVDELLADKSIDIVLNLTIPHAHGPVALQALGAGKHVYGEKPYAVTRVEGSKVLALAKKKKLRTGCAPDTFMGGAIQTCRKLIDDGVIGDPVSATAFMQCHGHETWHPSPEFYYQPGGGPMFDMGPYYLTALVALFGPVRRVTGSAQKGLAERTITSKPKYGQVIKVNTPTHISGVLDFADGAVGTIITTFDVYAHHLPCIEVHGTKGSMSVPDPNSFGGWKGERAPVQVWTVDKPEWTEVPYTHGYFTNSRGVGVADMAKAIRTGRTHRANGEMAFHVLDIMQSINDASESGKHMVLKSACERPAALPVGLKDGELD